LLLLHGGTGFGGELEGRLSPAAIRTASASSCPDLRGHGRSTNPSPLFTFRQAAHDMFALLDSPGHSSA